MEILGSAESQNLYLACNLESMLDCRTSCTTWTSPSGSLPLLRPGGGEHPAYSGPLCFCQGGLVAGAAAIPCGGCCPNVTPSDLSGLVEAQGEQSSTATMKGFQLSYDSGDLGTLEASQWLCLRRQGTEATTVGCHLKGSWLMDGCRCKATQAAGAGVQ